MAMAEGLPEAMAAITLKTPYITSGSGTQVRDIRYPYIRDIEGLPIEELKKLPKDIFSGPAIAALFWEIALKANEIESPGDPSLWATIDPTSIARLYALQYYIGEITEDTIVAEILDFPSLFTQLNRLSEVSGTGEAINLAEIFTDEVISELTESFFGEKIWPHWPETDEEKEDFDYFIKDWGTDPDSGKEDVPIFILSMADSVLDAEGNYSNITKNEFFTSRIKLSKDTPYRVLVTTEPPLPDDASIELRINRNTISPYIFNSASPGPKRIVLTGTSDYLVNYSFDFCIKSPKRKVDGDVRVTVRLDPSY